MAELTHEQLWKVCQRKPGDYEPYGKRKRLKGTKILSDCSGGCKWYHTLSGPPHWTGASAAIPGPIASDSSPSSIKGVPSLSLSERAVPWKSPAAERPAILNEGNRLIS
jgi:hypothetical protein